jgi:hypothetical protein
MEVATASTMEVATASAMEVATASAVEVTTAMESTTAATATHAATAASVRGLCPDQREGYSEDQTRRSYVHGKHLSDNCQGCSVILPMRFSRPAAPVRS